MSGSCAYTATGDYQCSSGGSGGSGPVREPFYADNQAVTMYEHCSYGQPSVSKPVGRYNMNEMGLGNDKISAIKVKPGYQVTVYEHSNFGGRSQVFNSDSAASCLLSTPGGDWNDRISSYVVENEPVVTMFEHCNFVGRSVSKPVGRYNLNEMGIDNDMISSIKVKPGFRVTVYEHSNFSGSNRIFMGDVPCLVSEKINKNKNWNDLISSFVVARN